MSRGEDLRNNALTNPILLGDADTRVVDAEYRMLVAEQGLTIEIIEEITRLVLSGALPVEEAQSQLALINEQANREVVHVYREPTISDQAANLIVQSLVERDPQTGEIQPGTIGSLQRFARATGEISGERPMSLMHLSGPDAIAVANLASSAYLRQVGEFTEAMGSDDFVATQALIVEGEFSEAALYEVAMRVDDLCMQTTFSPDEVAFIDALIQNPELVARIIREYPDMEDRLTILQGY